MGHIYILHAIGTNYYKIGMTENGITFRYRLGMLRTGCPHPLMPVAIFLVHDYRYTEKLVHDYLKDFRVRREWFELDEDELESILYQIQNISEECDCSTFCRKEYKERDEIYALH